MKVGIPRERMVDPQSGASILHLNNNRSAPETDLPL